MIRKILLTTISVFVLALCDDLIVFAAALIAWEFAESELVKIFHMLVAL